MKKLTARQQEILDYIQAYAADNGMPPTRAEIGGAMGFKSPNAAEDHLRALAQKGAIELIPGTSRGIRLPEAANEGVPLIGQVAAGSPILASENLEKHLPIDPDMFRPRADFMLRVRGDSMIDAGIMDGDLLAVHKTQQIREGDIAVVRIDDEVTVKRWHRVSAGHVQLIAENPAYDPIDLREGDAAAEIEGLAVGLLRTH